MHLQSTSNYFVNLASRFLVAGPRKACLQKRSRRSCTSQEQRKIISKANMKKKYLQCSELLLCCVCMQTPKMKILQPVLKVFGISIKVLGLKPARADLSPRIPRHPEAFRGARQESKNRRPRASKAARRQCKCFGAERKKAECEILRHQGPDHSSIRRRIPRHSEATPQTAPQSHMRLEFSENPKYFSNCSKCMNSSQKSCNTIKTAQNSNLGRLALCFGFSTNLSLEHANRRRSRKRCLLSEGNAQTPKD